MVIKFFQTQSNADSKFTNRLSLQIEARKAADAVIKELREATEIVKPGLGKQTLLWYTWIRSIRHASCTLRGTRKTALNGKKTFSGLFPSLMDTLPGQFPLREPNWPHQSSALHLPFFHRGRFN